MRPERDWRTRSCAALGWPPFAWDRAGNVAATGDVAGCGRVTLGGGEKVGEARAPDHAGVRLATGELYSQSIGSIYYALSRLRGALPSGLWLPCGSGHIRKEIRKKKDCKDGIAGRPDTREIGKRSRLENSWGRQEKPFWFEENMRRAVNQRLGERKHSCSKSLQ